MWILPFLYILLICQSSSIANEVEQKVEDVTLDLSDPDSSKVDVLIRRPYGMVSTFYVARDGYMITEVTDGPAILWKADTHSCEHVVLTLRDDDSPGFLLIHTRSVEGGKTPFYYRMKSCKWEITTEEEFYKCFNNEVYRESIIETIALDIKAWNDASKLYINGSSNFPFAVYAPGAGYRIAKVTCGTISRGDENVPCTVWNAMSSYEGCLYASFYPRETPIVAYLMVSSDHGTEEFYYHRVGEEWISATRNEYKLGLYTNGFNESTFDNTIILDIANVDLSTFHIKRFPLGDYSVDAHIPCVGFRLTEVRDDSAIIWKASGEASCTFVNLIFKDRKPFSFFILVDDPKNGRNVLYYVKNDEWRNVEKDGYYMHTLGGPLNGTELPKMENPRITMSSFRNKQGLRLTSYASTVDNSRGDIILVHGVRSHFMSEFSASDTEWNHKHIGFPGFPYTGPFGGYKPYTGSSPADLHRHLFEHGRLNGMNAFEVSPRYEYKHSLVEFLNRMGYNVYGYDLQAHGLSDLVSVYKCHVNEFKDHVNDLLQFISIVRRGRFYDSSEEWDENTVLKSLESHHKTILWGNSLGANVAIQAIQEFNRRSDSIVTSNRPILDGLISTSGMFSVDSRLNTWERQLLWMMSPIILWYSPEGINKYEPISNYGEGLELFIRHKDPFCYTKKVTYKTTGLMIGSCYDVKKDENMAFYPMSLPTLLTHTKDDGICDAKGSKEMAEKLVERGATDVKLIELDGSFHYHTIPQSLMVLHSHFREWLEQHT